MDAVLQRHLFCYASALHEIEQALIHRAHALGTARGDGAVQLMRLLLANKVADCRVRDHDLEGRRRAAVDGGHKLLRHDCLQHHGQLNTDLALLRSGEGVDDAIHRACGARSVQRREQQLRHLGRSHRSADGVLIAHLAQQDDVRALAHGRAQGLAVRCHVGGHFALRDDAGAVLVHVLDGVFHRDDVAGTFMVQAVDDACQRRGLAGARRAGDQHEPLLELGQAQHLVGDVEFRRIGQAEGDDADDRSVRTALTEDVRAEAPDAGQGEREVVVVIAVLHEGVHVAARCLVDGSDEGLGVGRLERCRIQSNLAAAHAVRQRKSCDNEDVGCLRVHHLLQEMLQFHRASPIVFARRPTRAWHPGRRSSTALSLSIG